MNEQTKITIRLKPELNEKFRSKLKQGGWSATKLLNEMIREFVQKEEAPFSNVKKKEPRSVPESIPYRETLTGLNEQIGRLNQRIEQMERTILQLDLIHQPTFTTEQQKYLINKIN